MEKPVHLIWLRRDLRLHDHAALAAADGPALPVFIFDTDILSRFSDPDDRRLSFIAAALCRMETALATRSSGVLVLHGPARVLVPQLAEALQAPVTAAEDYEPETRQRDAAVAGALAERFALVKDQVIFSPREILRDGAAAYKVFTPYAKAWRAALDTALLTPYPAPRAWADAAQARGRAAEAGLCPLEANDPAALLERIGYRYRADALWPAEDGPARLAAFMATRAARYKATRNLMAEPATSRLSPYLRFGLVSVRECAAAAVRAQADTWLSELIWREFYAMNLYHVPESARQEWNPKYRDVLPWVQDDTLLAAWQQGQTGYPVVDAAMRQLQEEGWMHNRARMIVASFLTKHLRLDWRRGEAHFARYLMDYDLASNVGGWQWAASTGTDAQPYFRVFNPVLQSEKYDPAGAYIRRYVPELRDIPPGKIHAPWAHGVRYFRPVVVHEEARLAAIAMFKAIG